MMGYGDFSHALFFGHHLKASIIKGLSLKTPQKRLILVNTSLSTPPRPPIAPYRHVKPLDRQTYHRHHRQAHSANGERIADFSDQYEHGKKMNTTTATKPAITTHWQKVNSKLNT